MTSTVAIVGMACIYPDVRSPEELWENVLAQRRAFRNMPSVRLRIGDYLSKDRGAADSTYAVKAAVIEGYEFDRVSFRVAASTFRSADPVHWLALDVAARALDDAGYRHGEGLPRDMTGVFLGNTLTGDISRANVMRLRWPYVRRVIQAALEVEGWSTEQVRDFLTGMEAQYKAPFPPIGEESLPGGMSNTISGRICNYFDLKGGGYTVDGACASSLLAVSNACSSLTAGDLDVALAGGVDLSLDPFEIVGFAKMGVLAPEEMRVYDARSSGFWPGEGCGFMVLMRYEDAVALRRRIYAVIHGWGISSDGAGGITRPEVDGQILALQRAYRRAGFGIETVSYFEGHGTGTSVGDATELSTLSRARREADPWAPAAVIGSIKANIGHTKAAAGVAGLIKATMALHTQVLPPTTGCVDPHPELLGERPALQVLDEAKAWPADRPLRAGVSAMGFGGINVHIVLGGTHTKRRQSLGSLETLLTSSAQDAELFLLGGLDAKDVRRQVDHLLTFASKLSQAELADLAAQMELTLDNCQMRGALVASSPEELVSGLETLGSWINSGETARLDVQAGVFLGTALAAPRIGFLFPGQGSPPYLDGGALPRRFEFVRGLYGGNGRSNGTEVIATEVVQPAIVTNSVAALRVLEAIGIEASIAVGHSLGEITAVRWAGALDEAALLRIATSRGQVIAELGSRDGAMASIGAGRQAIEELLIGEPVVIASLNSPAQTVVSGQASAVDNVIARAQMKGLKAVRLPVSHAFHSSLVAKAAPALAQRLSRETFHPLSRSVVSTVTGAPIAPNDDLPNLLFRQMTSPVRFIEAVTLADQGVDLWLEVGPGHVLSMLAGEFLTTPIVALDAGGPRLRGLLQAVGAAFALGAPVDHKGLFTRRFTRPFSFDWHPQFFANPCELAPVPNAAIRHDDVETQDPRATRYEGARETVDSSPDLHEVTPLDLLKQLVAARAELPPSSLKDEDHLLTDLHLNSISVSEIVVEAARRLGFPPPVAPTHYADATLADVARGLEETARNGDSISGKQQTIPPAGVESWIRTFTVEPVERPLAPCQPIPPCCGVWRVFAPLNHPLRDALQEAFDRSGMGSGVVVALPPEPDEPHVSLLLEGARAVLAEKEVNRFVLVQHGGGASAFARTLHLESPKITTCVVDVPLDHPKAAEWAVLEAMAGTGYSEARYDTAGRRWEPALRLIPQESGIINLPLGPHDVLLVTGGGKGIAAECALKLAQETGVRLALLGRSHPSTDAELAANLQRLAAADVYFRYISADVTDEQAIRRAVEEAAANLGPITAILHGAGTNVPQLLGDLDEEAFLSTLAPKVQGARNVLAAVNPDRLRLFITFGSIIARTGMRGEADYALANEWLTRLTERFKSEHPACHCIAVEWSIWSGVGMGERLGRIDALVRQGITPISPDEGVSILRRLIAHPPPQVAVVVTGRFGEVLAVKGKTLELPFLRFLENPKVYYPGVELVVDTDLSPDTDRYLDDHVFQGQRLLPAVMGLEAMAQASMTLIGAIKPPVFENVKFIRPVVVPDGKPVTVRVAALVQNPGRVQMVLRSDNTGFQADHIQATCSFEHQDARLGGTQTLLREPVIEATDLAINPEGDVYGKILFHSGRFRRLRGYKRLRATECIAEISPDVSTNWFARYLPEKFVLGDPAARDAAIHAIQSCIPHAMVLPIGVDKLEFAWTETSTPRFVYAKERSRDNSTFIYDVEVTDAEGQVGERWEGLQLRMVAGTTFEGEWVEPLLGPYIERSVSDLVPGSKITVEINRWANGDRRSRSDRAIQQILGEDVLILRRPDGKPELGGNHHAAVSVAHTGDLTLAVAGPGPVGCDVEPVADRPDSLWQELLGRGGFQLAQVIVQEGGESLDRSATRVWATMECLKKAGVMSNGPLVLASLSKDGWVLLGAGQLVTATVVITVRGAQNPLVLAVLVGSDHANL